MKKRGRMRGKCKRTKRHKQIQGEIDSSEDIQMEFGLIEVSNITTIPFKEDLIYVFLLWEYLYSNL